MPPTIVGIDTGGTFTDFLLIRDGRLQVHKVPSTPDDPSQAILQGLRELGLGKEEEGGGGEVVFVHGSTVATNALLERRGARTALVTTAGFEDILEIGRQARPHLYDLMQERPPPLVPPALRFGAPERVASDGSVLTPLSSEEARKLAREVAVSGAEAVAVSLLFSFLRPTHEEMILEALTELDPPPFLSIASRVLPEYREYERTSTVAVNAYLGPLMAGYLRWLEESLERWLGGWLEPGIQKRGARLRVMQSSGGGISAEAAASQPVRTILSGPAGGVVGAFAIAQDAGFPDVITLDMGGTSTDVALCPGAIQETGATVVGGLPVSVPIIAIHTVGAGGGSIARMDAGGALLVGPQSAGADPGPACYGRGEEVTVTDANLLLGRIDQGFFLGGRMALDPGRAQKALGRLADAMNSDPLGAAAGVVRVVNANMERAIRAISLERGFDPRDFTLMAFGGAGPQHACELAEELRIPRVLVPPFPGALSAFGVAIADVVKDYSRTVLMAVEELTTDTLGKAFRALEEQGRADLQEEGVRRRQMALHRLLDMRYVGQSYELSVECPPLRGGVRVSRRAAERFHKAHQGRFGYSDASQPVEVVNVRLKAVGLTEKPSLRSQRAAAVSSGRGPSRSERIEPIDHREAVFGGQLHRTAFYLREHLKPGDAISGPAVVLQMDATTVVSLGWRGTVDEWGNLVLAVLH